MDVERVQHFAARVEAHLFNHILPFWSGPALDDEQGGWLAWMSNDLRVDRSQPKGLIVNSRILWAFSAVYRVRPEPLWEEMAHRAFDGVMNRFWDSEQGGAFWRLTAEGKVFDDSKKIYGQAFYIYALAEYFRAFADSTALTRAISLFNLIERHAYDASHGGYWEVCHRDWVIAESARLSDKDMAESKSMNTHLHVLEAYTNLFRVWKDSRVERRLRELVQLFESRILDAKTSHLHHFFDAQWQVRSDTYTFGHDIEASWLLCEAAEALDETVVARIIPQAVNMARVVLAEAIPSDGGMYYEGKEGRIIDFGRECWPQAEALVGFINAFQLSRDPRFLQAAEAIWEYIDRYLVDRIHGEWFWRIGSDGKPDSSLPKVSEWKGPYHATRACLEIARRLRQSAGNP